ncbi:HD-GYP domain-containing protein [Paenibacillus sedimenti]|uniref:HD-GYP domain-containing protein n=1 Tax=Paenibacillus sedimenti TaxID=2770274 RepID=A0A926QIE1_9BACL|nr:HD-GYP domain-containing protein [Paenibacillus sedimenti]MBD0380410.1 HD-GYP domain-containing protein [Paenibacillus sedimenti]
MKRFLGRRVKQDVVNSYGLVLLPAQSVIGSEELELLQMHRIDLFTIIFDVAAEPAKVSSETQMQQVVQNTKALFHSIQLTKKIPLLEIREEVIPAVQQMTENPNVFQLFEAVRAKDDYTHQHNIGVGVLATLIGKWMNLSAKELTTLSLAATLHDVGKLRIPSEILNKPGKLSREEYEIIKRHSLYGYEMLKDTVGVGPRVAAVALQHHEREDGTGYPNGLKNGDIDMYSKIVAVADVFHAMTSKRPYHEPKPFHEVLGEMQNGKFGEFDPEIVSVFLNNITRHLVGNQVVLSDGRQGEVVYINPHDAGNPLVKVGDEFIDLSKDREIHIQSVIA